MILSHLIKLETAQYDSPVIVIRTEHPGDIPAIRELNIQAFGRSDEGRLVDAVRQRREPTFSFVAVDADDDDATRGPGHSSGPVIGHVLFSPVSIASPERTCSAIGLGPIAVRPDHQKTGVGGRLIEHGFESCRAAGYEIVVVLGHPHYYPKFGFVMAHPRGIHWEHEMPGDPFMVKELKPGALDRVTGTVCYLPEFMSL